MNTLLKLGLAAVLTLVAVPVSAQTGDERKSCRDLVIVNRAGDELKICPDVVIGGNRIANVTTKAEGDSIVPTTIGVVRGDGDTESCAETSIGNTGSGSCGRPQREPVSYPLELE